MAGSQATINPVEDLAKRLAHYLKTDYRKDNSHARIKVIYDQDSSGFKACCRATWHRAVCCVDLWYGYEDVGCLPKKFWMISAIRCDEHQSCVRSYEFITKVGHWMTGARWLDVLADCRGESSIRVINERWSTSHCCLCHQHLGQSHEKCFLVLREFCKMALVVSCMKTPGEFWTNRDCEDVIGHIINRVILTLDAWQVMGVKDRLLRETL